MIVVSLKWVPYLLVFGGAVGLITGEDVGFSIGMLVVGGIWLLLKRNSSANKGTSTEKASPNTDDQTANTTPPRISLEGSEKKSVPGAVRYCPRCGQAYSGDAVFCSQDGEKLI